MLISAFIVVLIIIALWLLTSGTEPLPIIGIYREPGRWYKLKYWAFFALMRLRQRRSRNEKVTGVDAGYGMRSRSSIEAMDAVQLLPKEHPLAVDAVYFNGANADNCWFVAATARRHDGLVQTLLYLRIDGVGLLELPSLPDTSLEATADGAYAAGGLIIEPIEPMKRWKLSFNGRMRLIKMDGIRDDEVNVSFSLDWTAYTKQFDFDTDLPTNVLCDAIAREPWSRKLFESLRVAHQTHYEQFGELTGTVHIEKCGDIELAVRGVRDHSYGNIRDWRDLHRYAIQYLYLKNGMSICIGNICMPKNMSRLIIGYVFFPDGRLDPVTSSDLNLHSMGEDGNDPTDFKICFVAGDETYHLEGHVVDRPVFYMGREWDSRIVERMCTYKVNSVPGWGISEWCYRHHGGRLPAEIASNKN